MTVKAVSQVLIQLRLLARFEFLDCTSGLRVLIALYYLLNLGIGTATVIVNFTSAPGRASAGSVSYFDVASVGSSSSNNGAGSPASIDVSSNAGQLVVDIISAGLNASPLTVGSGQTSRWQWSTVGAMSDKIGDSPVTTMTWTLAGGTPAPPAKMGPPVGGFVEPVNKLGIVAPYLALFGAIAAVAIVVVKPSKKRGN